MENQVLGSKSAKQQLHHIADNVAGNLHETSDTIQKMSSNIGSRANRLASDASSKTSEYYAKANTWVQENYGKTLGAVGVLAVVGIAGYLLGKNQSKSEIQFPAQHS